MKSTYWFSGFILLGLLLFKNNYLLAQTITGHVYEKVNGQNSPLIGASVYWPNNAAGTVTNDKGFFTLALPSDSTAASTHLIVSYIGYQSDTVAVEPNVPVNVVLQKSRTLNEVTVIGKTERFSALTPTHTQIITAKDLTKSACCNLAESFETNASVEVTTSDAVSGARQIQMLGLDGAYTLLTTDNIPNLRGLATPYRLNYLSGTYIESIDIIKGMGSVINGYESISGQVNVRLKEPEKTDRLLVNLYGNSLAKFDGNVNFSTNLTKKLSTVLMFHTDHIGNRVDRNHDRFLDLPLSTQYNVFNKWKYLSGKNVVSEVGIQALQEDRLGGQVDYQKGQAEAGSQANYGIESNTKRLQAYNKTSYTFPGKPYQSIGVIVSGTRHQFHSIYRQRQYNGEQNSLLARLLFQSIFGNTQHTYKAGLDYQRDDYQEQLSIQNFNRKESVPGAFFEYVYQDNQNLTIVAGARYNYHNLYGSVFTPRLNFKYDFTPNSIFRVAAGQGFRVANPIAENSGSLVSSRAFIFNEKLQPEKAWNVGGSFTQYFTIGTRKGTFVTDYYYTRFRNQVVADMYSNPNAVIFSNLQGKSFSKSFQTEVQLEVAPGLDLKAAYKYFDVRTTYNNNLLNKPFNPKHRFFVNAAFATPFDKWRVDLTTQWFGLRPVPTTEHTHPGSAQEVKYSERYYVLNGQVTRAFKRFELYAGGENLLNFKQANPIIDAGNPFGNNFDASMVWGPIVGRVIYGGLRFKIE
ncbi:TonB-dependent receptor [Adhaeribacter swui]|uniref:TonB-dependent receptor n=1 Tax=Adhaeribacter swui TaxID=2086471 RepID=A0A7G7GAU6_9BACT|nr:TonB-dependent receptor [Adhaeribacter swui]QNF34280.1 TonB-dependent receptor [Adhaeribacter swui]